MTRKAMISTVLVVICCGSLISAFIVGISGNLPGLALCYVAAISIILALVHSWRRSKYFLILLCASLAGFAVFVLLHNVFYALSQMATDIIILRKLLEFSHALFFLIAILVCPAGFLVGIVGSIITTAMYFRKRRTKDKVI